MKKRSNVLSSAVMVIVLGCIFIMIPSCNVSTANLTDVKLCTQKNSSGVCDSDASTFPADVQVVYCSAILKNAPADTKVTFEWKHEGQSLGKADVETSSGSVSSNFSPNAELEPGKYSVTVKINTDNATPVTKEFTIE